MKIYKIYACLDNDISDGFVWLKRASLTSRCIIKIKNLENGRSVFCEALQFDDNFLHHYSQSPRLKIDSPESSIIMSSWYRARLGDLETQRQYSLDIGVANGWWGKLRACMHHPQIIVRVAVWLGAISVALGVVGVVMSMSSVWAGQGSRAGQDEEILAEMQQVLARAWMAGDRATIEQIIAPEWRSTGPDGRVTDRAQVLADVFEKRVHTIHRVEINDVRAHVFGHAAVVTGRTHGVGDFAGSAYDVVIRFTDTFVLREGRWQAVASHASLLAAGQ